MHRRLKHQARRQPGRRGQPALALPLTTAGHRHVRRQNQRMKPRRLDPVKHVASDIWVTRRIELKPPLIARMRTHCFGRLAGHRGQGIGNAHVAAQPGQATFGILPDQPRHAHRGDAEGQGIVTAQKATAKVHFELTGQNGGVEQHRVQSRAIARLRRTAAGGAVEVFPDESGYAAPGAGGEIGDGGV